MIQESSNIQPSLSYRTHVVFLTFLFISGFSGVAYEILWLRSLHLILGSDSLAVALILAAFMAGLGAGSWFIGRLSDHRSPLHLYRWMEFGIGIFGVLSPWILKSSSIPYHYLFTILKDSPEVLLIGKFVLGFVCMFIPSFLMGGTLPAAVRFMTDDFDIRGRWLALIYGINTLGAFSSALVVPFFLMPHIDHTLLIYISASGNFAVFLGTFFLKAPSASFKNAKKNLGDGPHPITISSLLPITLFITGFVSISLETIWNRLFSLHFTSSIYTFSIILALYLLGIGSGSLAHMIPLIAKQDPRRTFALTQLLIAGLILIQTLFFDKVSGLQLWLMDRTGSNFSSYVTVAIIVIGIVIVPVVFLFGISFPAALTLFMKDRKFLGSETGFLIAVNTLGTTCASLVITFVGYFYLGSRNILLLLAFFSFLNFMVLTTKTQFPRNKKVVIAGFLTVLAFGFSTTWNLKNFHLLLAQKPDWTLERYRDGQLENYKKGLNLLTFREDREAVVSVAEHPDDHRILYINGKPDASDYLTDMHSQFLCGHVPFLYRESTVKPDVLVLGLGSGTTTYAASLHTPMSLLTLEISPSVIDCARTFFSKTNGDIISTTKLRVDDGRQYIQSTDESFDIIISEPSNPWISGISNLFTDEFFKAVRKRLKPGGIFCQWFYFYKMDFDHVRGLIATLHETFPYVNVFNVSGDLIIVASETSLEINPKLLFSPSTEIRGKLQDMGFSPPETIMNFFLWNEAQVSTLGSVLSVNRDGLPWVEFDAPKFLFSDFTKSNLHEFAQVSLESEIPIILSKSTVSDQLPGFDNLQLKMQQMGMKSVSKKLVRRTFDTNPIFVNVFWEIQFSDANGGSISVSNPILNGRLNRKAAGLILDLYTKSWYKRQAVTVTLPRYQFLSFVEDGPPFRWAGIWTCEPSGRSFILTIDADQTIPSRAALLSFLEDIQCQ